MANGTIINLNNTTPAAPEGYTNVLWLADNQNPRNVSASILTPAVANLADATVSSPAAGQMLTYSGTTWVNGTGPLTTAGDVLYMNATPAVARLPIGATGQVLTVASGVPSWQTLSLPTAGVITPATGVWFQAMFHSQTFAAATPTGNLPAGCVEISLPSGSGPIGSVAPTSTSAQGYSNTGSATAGSSTGFYEGAGVLSNMKFGTFKKFITRITWDSTTNIRWWIALNDQGSSGPTALRADKPAANVVGLRFSPTSAGDTTVQAYVGTDATHQTIVGTGITPDTNKHTYEIDWSGVNYTFYIDGSLVATISTNVPAASTTLYNAAVSDNASTAHARTATCYAWYYEST